MEPPCACSWRPHQHAREVPHPHAHDKAHKHAPDGLTRTCAWSLREHYHSKEICLPAMVKPDPSTRLTPNPSPTNPSPNSTPISPSPNQIRNGFSTNSSPTRPLKKPTHTRSKSPNISPVRSSWNLFPFKTKPSCFSSDSEDTSDDENSDDENFEELLEKLKKRYNIR